MSSSCQYSDPTQLNLGYIGNASWTTTMSFMSAFRMMLPLFSAAMIWFVLSNGAIAGHCGSPPDPQYNTSGYSSWCSCMNGIYDYQTTACSGAYHSDTGSNYDNGNDGYYDTPSGIGWFCAARASDGSWGWGESLSKSNATSYALSECGKHANNCKITGCQQGGGKNYDTSTGRWKKKPATTTKKSNNKGKLSCSICYTKLVNDINSGWASSNYRTYVSQSISGYKNCRRKSDQQCSAGNKLETEISLACILSFGESYKKCVKRIMNAH